MVRPRTLIPVCEIFHDLQGKDNKNSPTETLDTESPLCVISYSPVKKGNRYTRTGKQKSDTRNTYKYYLYKKASRGTVRDTSF